MSYIVGGCSTYSKQPARFPPNYPPHLIRGRGCTVRGSDGKTYIDLISGLGAIFLGYQHPRVDLAVMRQLQEGTLFSLPHAGEEIVAEQLCLMTDAEQVRFCKNGSDATEAAVRLARYVTGKETIITLGGYHGFHSDLVGSTPGKVGGVLPETLGTLAPLDPTDEDFLETFTYWAPRAACLIAEPLSVTDDVPWLAIQTCLERLDCLLVLDEVISGFRYRAGAAKPTLHPDLACYGKALGNGHPIAALVGRKELMGELNEYVFFSGTHAAECLSLAAAGAMLAEIVDDPALYDRMREAGSLLIAGFTQAAQETGVAATCVGLPPRTQFHFEEPAEFDRFRAGMAARGVLLGRDNFLTTAHTVAVVEGVLRAVRGALEDLHG